MTKQLWTPLGHNGAVSHPGTIIPRPAFSPGSHPAESHGQHLLVAVGSDGQGRAVHATASPSILHTCRRPRSTNPSHLCSGLYLMMLLRLLLILRRRDPEQLDMALRRATTNCSLAAGPKDFPSCAHRSYR